MSLYSILTGYEATSSIPVMKQEIILDLKVLLSDTPTQYISGEYIHIQGVMQNIYKELLKNPARQKKYERFF